MRIRLEPRSIELFAAVGLACLALSGCDGRAAGRPDSGIATVPYGAGGAIGTGGANGTGGATSPPARSYGMTCATTSDCSTIASSAICCDGSNQSCDGTRLPTGDGTNAGQFVVSGDGLTVSDTITGLVWQRDGSGTRTGCSGSTCLWADAKTYCAGLTLAGLSGWRLPALVELRTIVDFTVADPEPTVDQTAFPSTPSKWFWTSSPYAGSPDKAWYVDFSNGFSYYGGVGYYGRVRCVR